MLNSRYYITLAAAQLLERRDCLNDSKNVFAVPEAESAMCTYLDALESYQKLTGATTKEAKATASKLAKSLENKENNKVVYYYKLVKKYDDRTSHIWDFYSKANINAGFAHDSKCFDKAQDKLQKSIYHTGINLSEHNDIKPINKTLVDRYLLSSNDDHYILGEFYLAYMNLSHNFDNKEYQKYYDHLTWGVVYNAYEPDGADHEYINMAKIDWKGLHEAIKKGFASYFKYTCDLFYHSQLVCPE